MNKGSEEDENGDERGWEGVVRSKLIIVSVFHTIRVSLIFNTGLGMTLAESQYCIPPNLLTTDADYSCH